MTDTETVNAYPGIVSAVLMMASDNGSFHAGVTRDDLDHQLAATLEELGYGKNKYNAINAWLVSLAPFELETVCCGDEFEATSILSVAPEGTNELLMAIFENVI